MSTYGRKPSPKPYQYEPVSTPLTPQDDGYRSVLRPAPTAEGHGYQAAAANAFIEADWSWEDNTAVNDDFDQFGSEQEYEYEREFAYADEYSPFMAELGYPSTTRRMALVLIGVMLIVLLGVGGLWWFGWGAKITAVAANNSHLTDSSSNAVVAPVVSDALAPSDAATATADILASGQLSPAFAPEVLFWAPKIIEWAGQWNLDPNLVATVMQIESCGDPHAISSAGARGLFQVMPFHFEDGEDMLHPDTNAYRGMSYLSLGLTLRDGDANLAMAGYNGGHGTVPKGWGNWPHEMQRYYRWGSGIYGEVTAGESSSATLAQWLAAGGASLCRQAADRQVALGLR